MLASDEKTVWESWDGVASRNHPALGAVDAWFYEGLAGIRPVPGTAFSKVIIAPPLQQLPGLTWVRASHESPRGTIKVEWRRQGKTLNLKISIPVGMTAKVRLLPRQLPLGEIEFGSGEQSIDYDYEIH